MAAAAKARVGLRIGLTAFWTLILTAGLTLGVLVAAPGFASSLQGALTATLEASSIAAAAAVAMILLGLWGIASNRKNLTHSLELIAEIDRARKETIQLETSRFSQYPK